jgi:hypothetical protein
VKNLLAKILLVSLMLAFAAIALALESITLKDSETGNTIVLYPIPDEAELLFYSNERFEYSVSVPHKVFTKVVVLPDNGDGMILESKDGKARFRVSGGYVMVDRFLKESYDSARESITGDWIIEDEIGEDYWKLAWREEDVVHYRKFRIKGEEAWADCEIYYEWEEGVVDDPLPDLTDRAVDSLAFGEG